MTCWVAELLDWLLNQLPCIALAWHGCIIHGLALSLRMLSCLIFICTAAAAVCLLAASPCL